MQLRQFLRQITTLNSCISKEKRSQIHDLSFPLREAEEQMKPKAESRKEIIKAGVGIDETGKIMKTKAVSFWINMNKPLARIIRKKRTQNTSTRRGVSSLQIPAILRIPKAENR